MTRPLFTQKHYECLIEELRPLRPGFANQLCSIFERDNPKFNAAKFRYLIQSPAPVNGGEPRSGLYEEEA